MSEKEKPMFRVEISDGRAYGKSDFNIPNHISINEVEEAMKILGIDRWKVIEVDGWKTVYRSKTVLEDKKQSDLEAVQKETMYQQSLRIFKVIPEVLFEWEIFGGTKAIVKKKLSGDDEQGWYMNIDSHISRDGVEEVRNFYPEKYIINRHPQPNAIARRSMFYDYSTYFPGWEKLKTKQLRDITANVLHFIEKSDEIRKKYIPHLGYTHKRTRRR